MQRYSRIAIFLHWTIAAAIAFQIAVGWGLEDLGKRGFNLFQLHKSIGIAILLLSLARIVQRYTRPRPAAVEGGLTGAIATLVHGGLYFFMIAAPLTGWAIVSTTKVKVPTLLFWTIPWPHLPLPQGVNKVADVSHSVLPWIGIALLALHVAGALRHHMLLRDGLIWRMVPGRSAAVMALLLALVPVGFLLGELALPLMSSGNRPAVADAPAPQPENAAVETGARETNAAAPAIAAAPKEATAGSGTAAETEKPQGPPPRWTIQPGGQLGFSLGNGGDRIDGHFGKWTGAIAMDPDHPESATIRLEVDLATATVGDPTQDGMLAGDEFFATAAHPKAVYTSAKVERTGPDSYRARGTLSLKGVSAPQSIRFTLSGTGLRRKVQGSATIARKTFGVGNGDSAADLDAMVAVNFAFSAKGKAG